MKYPLLWLLAFCVITGCERRDKTIYSNITTAVGDRPVHASVPGTATISPEGDTAVITTETHKFIVERERVVLDGTELVKLPAGAKIIIVEISSDKLLTVKADRVAVLTKQLAK